MKKIVLSILFVVFFAGAVDAAWYWPFGSDEPKSYIEPAPMTTAPRGKYLPKSQQNFDKVYPKAPMTNEGVSVKKIKELADAGNANAQLTLGKIYFDGLVGEKQSYKKALKYFTKAAKNGSPEAMYNIGICYDGGFGMRKPNIKQAVAWYRKAADAGVPEAQLKSAVWAEAHGDAEIAFKYYKMLADDGNLECMNQVALFLLNGFGTQANPAEAVRYLRTSAQRGNNRAMIRLADCYQQGVGVDCDYHEMAKWLELAAIDGDPEAQAKLGQCYQSGMGVVVNNENAFKWYKISAEGTYAPGQYLLGKCYSDGIGTTPNATLAAECYRQAAEQGDAYGQMEYAECLRKGIGVKIDADAAQMWMTKAADEGELAIAQARLAELLAENGHVEEAQKRIENAVNAKDPLAKIQAALCYINGPANIRNRDRGLKILHDLAANGIPEAHEILKIVQ